MQMMSIDDLQRYVRMIRARASHHAHDVTHAIATCVGAIVLRKDAGTPLACRENILTGEPTPQLVVTISGTGYAVGYDHDKKKIKVQKGGVRGPIVSFIDNTTRPEDIDRIFGAL